MPSTRYEAKIAAGTETGLGLYTQDWVEASTNSTDCNGKNNTWNNPCLSLNLMHVNPLLWPFVWKISAIIYVLLYSLVLTKYIITNPQCHMTNSNLIGVGLTAV